MKREDFLLFGLEGMNVVITWVSYGGVILLDDDSWGVGVDGGVEGGSHVGERGLEMEVQLGVWM